MNIHEETNEIIHRVDLWGAGMMLLMMMMIASYAYPRYETSETTRRHHHRSPSSGSCVRLFVRRRMKGGVGILFSFFIIDYSFCIFFLFVCSFFFFFFLGIECNLVNGKWWIFGNEWSNPCVRPHYLVGASFVEFTGFSFLFMFELCYIISIYMYLYIYSRVHMWNGGYGRVICIRGWEWIRAYWVECYWWITTTCFTSEIEIYFHLFPFFFFYMHFIMIMMGWIRWLFPPFPPPFFFYFCFYFSRKKNIIIIMYMESGWRRCVCDDGWIGSCCERTSCCIWACRPTLAREWETSFSIEKDHHGDGVPVYACCIRSGMSLYIYCDDHCRSSPSSPSSSYHDYDNSYLKVQLSVRTHECPEKIGLRCFSLVSDFSLLLSWR